MVYTDHQGINLVFGRVGLGIRRMNLGNEELQETGDVTFNCPFEGGASVVGGTMMIELL